MAFVGLPATSSLSGYVWIGEKSWWIQLKSNWGLQCQFYFQNVWARNTWSGEFKLACPESLVTIFHLTHKFSSVYYCFFFLISISKIFIMLYLSVNLKKIFSLLIPVLGDFWWTRSCWFICFAPNICAANHFRRPSCSWPLFCWRVLSHFLVDSSAITLWLIYYSQSLGIHNWVVDKLLFW